MSEERVTYVEIRVIVEGMNSDTGMVSDIREGEGEMKIIVESIKIREGGEEMEMIVESTKIREGGEEEIGKEGEGRGEEMKGREAGMAGKEYGRHTTSSYAKPLNSTSAFSSSQLLDFFFWLLFGLQIL